MSIVADATVYQAALSALSTVGASQPKLVNAPCVAQSVLDAVGNAGIDGTVLFTTGDTQSDDEEAQIYRAVMHRYAPKADAGGLTPTGYRSMLGFVRAVKAGGMTGGVTPQSIATALKAPKDVRSRSGRQDVLLRPDAVPRPGDQGDDLQFTPLCTTYSGLEPGTFEAVDAADALGR